MKDSPRRLTMGGTQAAPGREAWPGLQVPMGVFSMSPPTLKRKIATGPLTPLGLIAKTLKAYLPRPTQ